MAGEVTWITRGIDLPEPNDPYEIAHSTEEDWSINTDQFSARASLRCDWDDRHDTMYNILAAGRSWPYFDSDGQLRAVTGKITPYPAEAANDRAGWGNRYEYARLDIDFKIVTYDSNTRAMYAEELTPWAEMMNLPPKRFQWGTGNLNRNAWIVDGKEVRDDKLDSVLARNPLAVVEANPSYNLVEDEEAPSRKLYGFDYVITWYNMTSIPLIYLSGVNCVNYSAVTSPALGITFPAGTLLLSSSHAGRTVSFGGANRYTIEARWSYNAVGWSKLWRAREMKYDEIYVAGTNKKYNNYPNNNFAGLLP